MHIKSIIAVAGAVLMASAGAAQADEVTSVTSSSRDLVFSTLIGVTAIPLSTEESTSVFGRAHPEKLIPIPKHPLPDFPPDPDFNPASPSHPCSTFCN